jgi:pimeloyl-ACP methyl ester carboxylesterase
MYRRGAIPVAEGHLPVIFVPGLGGTELYNGPELVWINLQRLLARRIPGLNLLNLDWLMPLRLAPNGRTPYRPSYRIRTGDLLRRDLTDVYSGLIEALKRHGYSEGKDLRLLPYDWRLEPQTATDQLAGLVGRTLAETGARQVVLVGHSLGGLVIRDYLVRGGEGKVKAAVYLATPFLGAPAAYRALEYGWDLGLKIPGTDWSALAPEDIHLLAQNYPSVYALAPGRRYFDLYPEGYIQRDGRALGFGKSLEEALAPHNPVLAPRGPALQGRILDGKNHGALQFLLVGTGRPTLGRLVETRGWFGFWEMREQMTDGDEVVPLHSADLGYSVNPGNPARYIGTVSAVAYAPVGHTFFAQSAAVRRQVVTWLKAAGALND